MIFRSCGISGTICFTETGSWNHNCFNLQIQKSLKNGSELADCWNLAAYSRWNWGNSSWNWEENI